MYISLLIINKNQDLNMKFRLIIVLLIIISACKMSDNAQNYKSEPFMSDEVAVSDLKLKSSPVSRSSIDMNSTKPVQQNNKWETKLIKNASFTLEVKSFDKANDYIKNQIKNFNAYIADTRTSLNNASLTIKVQSDEFDNFLETLPQAGKITYRSIHIDDVTKRYYDLDTRIKNKRILQQTFQDYLKKAKTIDEIMKVQKELTDVTEEIESLTGQFDYLKDQINYSTINVSMTLPVSEQIQRKFPSFKRNLIDLGYNIIHFFNAMVFFIIYFIIFGIPVILFSALFWLIAFGKIGLIRKLFKISSKKQ